MADNHKILYALLGVASLVAFILALLATYKATPSQLTSDQQQICQRLTSAQLLPDERQALLHALKALERNAMGLPWLSPTAAELYSSIKERYYRLKQESEHEAQRFVGWAISSVERGTC